MRSTIILAAALLTAMTACRSSLSVAPKPTSSEISRQEAIDRVKSLRQIIGSLDRVEAKLSTLSQFRAVAPQDFSPALPDDTKVWVVAVRGQLAQPGGRVEVTPRSAVFLLHAETGEAMASAYSAEDWPAWFTGLPDNAH